MPGAMITVSQRADLDIRGNTDCSSEVSNIIAVEALLLYNSDRGPGSRSNHCEPSKTICYNNNDSAMIISRERLQWRKRIG